MPADQPTMALGLSRSRVLEVLQHTDGELSVHDVAVRVRLHPNTVRFHLDALVVAGLADRGIEDRHQPGRPRALYSARPGGIRAGQRSYQLLASILANYLAKTSRRPRQAALRSGQQWGRSLASLSPRARPASAAGTVDRLATLMESMGFAPQPIRHDNEWKVEIRQCPFREVAEANPEVVCSIHLGLMQGILAELDSPVTATKLHPFVEPDLCLAHLRQDRRQRRVPARSRQRAARH